MENQKILNRDENQMLDTIIIELLRLKKMYHERMHSSGQVKSYNDLGKDYECMQNALINLFLIVESQKK
jgi:hypothetical protein